MARLSKFRFLLFIILVGNIPVYSQLPGNKIELPKVIPPSPTVASLMHFEEVPVDYYTGQPDINIPIFSKKLKDDLMLPIALKYSSLGVKLSERSGWTGTGWSLEAGGTISRTVRGIPDDASVSGSTIATGIYNLPNSEYDMWGLNLLTNEQKNTYLWDVYGNNQKKYDSELDLYQFSILGATGRFVVDIDGATLVPKLLSKDQNVKIQVYSTSSPIKITGFTITDANGYKYHFGTAGSTGTSNSIEVTSSKPYSISYPQRPDGGVAPDFVTYDNETVCNTAWHLTSIQTPSNQILAQFYYTSIIEENYNTYINSIEHILESNLNYYLDSQSPNFSYNNSVLKPKRTNTYSRISVDTRKLSYIIFKDNTRVDFLTQSSHPEYVVYTPNLPASSASGTKLTGINLKDASGSVYKQYTLVYETTTPPYEPGDFAKKRLWLTKVRERSSDMPAFTYLDYILEYFDKEDLPGFSQGDGWGYMPARPATPGFLFNDTNFKKGLLTSIAYPTGGLKEFVWEPHSFSYEGNTLLAKTVTDANPRNLMPGAASKSFNCSNCSSSVVSSSFTIDQAQSINIQVSGSSIPANGVYWVRIEKQSGGSWNSVASLNTIAQSYYLAAGTYRFAIVIGVNYYTGAQFNGTVTLHYSNFRKGNSYHQYLMGGGARIGQVIFKESVEGPELRKTSYFYNEPQTETDFGSPTSGNLLPGDSPSLDPIGPSIKSSGSVDAKIGSLMKEDLISYPALLIGQSGCSVISVSYTYKSNEQTAQTTKGGYVGYKYVRVREEGAGFTAYSYTSPQDFFHPVNSSVFFYPFPEGNNLDFKRGNLLTKQIYDEEVRLLEETHNDYEYVEEVMAKSYVLNPIPCAYTSFYNSYQNYKNGVVNSEIPCSGTLGNDCSGGIANPPAPLSFITNTHTAGWAKMKESIVRKYFYGNTQENSEIKTTYEYNDVNYQIKNKTDFIKEGGVVNEYRTEYQYSVPQGGYDQTLFTTAENSVITAMRNTYNIINKPIVITSFKNDEQLQKIISKYSTSLGASFPVLANLEALKGMGTAEDRILYTKYDNSGNPLVVQMVDGKTISYLWGYNDTLPIAMLEGATYVGIATTLGLSESSIASLDEDDMAQINSLRSMSGALVTTLTYDPAKGVTSIIDPKGYRMYYKYDQMGRLTHVVDADNNIVSQNKYNYRTQN